MKCTVQDWWSDPCSNEATTQWDAVCVHEHITEAFMCDMHIEIMHAALASMTPNCASCGLHPTEAHECPVRPLEPVLLSIEAHHA